MMLGKRLRSYIFFPFQCAVTSKKGAKVGAVTVEARTKPTNHT